MESKKLSVYKNGKKVLEIHDVRPNNIAFTLFGAYNTNGDIETELFMSVLADLLTSESFPELIFKRHATTI